MRYRKKPVVIEAVQYTGLNVPQALAFVNDEKVMMFFPGPYGASRGWWHPVPYGDYVADQQIAIANYSAWQMTFKVKLSLRCKHFPDGTGP